MQPSNLFLAFLLEIVNRLRTKKPKIFVYLQYITTVLGAITGIPAFLESFGIKLPSVVTMFENKFIAAVAIGFAIASQLTTNNTTTPDTKLPFSTRMDNK